MVHPWVCSALSGKGLGVGALQQVEGLFYAEGILDEEDAASAALEAVQMSSAAESFSQVTCECTYVCAFAAGDPYQCLRKTERRIVSHVYPA